MKRTSVVSAVLSLAAAFAPVVLAQEPTPDVYSPSELATMEQALSKQAKKGLATQQLKKYSSDYTLLAFRSQSGQAEQHEKFADFYFVLSGEAKLVSGGKMVNGASTGQGELRGDSINGGKETTLKKGDIIHIPANIPHQLVLAKGTTFEYYVIKVQEVE
jgi:mannose-6-phosphate isomerase-like protein (cupin superfamily)